MGKDLMDISMERNMAIATKVKELKKSMKKAEAIDVVEEKKRMDKKEVAANLQNSKKIAAVNLED